ncbi:MAG: DUF2190 family protein [Elusimicrobia bacterium]|nr:DUF2190 family protein [Elusimicrobiota bacterium]
MGQYVDTNTRSFTAGETIAQHLRVKLSAGVLAVAGAADSELGTVLNRAVSGDAVAVRLRTAAGTCKMVASGEIAAGADVYTAAVGKITATAGSGIFCVGTSLEAATADGDVIEVLRHARGGPSTGE